MTQSLAILVLLVCIPSTLAVIGVDLSAPFNNFQCLKDNGYQFVIGRGYMSYGAVDYEGLANLQRAKAVGLIADAYFFPCKGKLSAEQQVSDFIGAFGEILNDSQEYGTVWVDVEINPSGGCGWSSDIHDNCAFLDALVNAFRNSGKLVGIYSSLYQWESIFGNRANCPFFTGLPLWYAHYDNDPSFNDYAKYSFGGWSKPSIKQYVGDTSACGVGIDLNYY